MLLGHELSAMAKLLNQNKTKHENKIQQTTPGSRVGSAGLGTGAKKVGEHMTNSSMIKPQTPGGRIGLPSFGSVGGRGSIPAGLTLKTHGSKSSHRPLPLPSVARAGSLGHTSRSDSPRPRSGSVDSTDGDTVTDMTTSQVNEIRHQILKDIQDLQESSLCWLAEILCKIPDPCALWCSLLPIEANSGRISSSSESGSSASTATSLNDLESIFKLRKEGSTPVPPGDSPCAFVSTTSGGAPMIVQMKEDNTRLWISWIKSCLCINVSQHYRVSRLKEIITFVLTYFL